MAIIWQGFEGEAEGIGGDRRRDRRHPILLSLDYRCTQDHRVSTSGHGMTLELSSRGLSFQCDGALDPGSGIELVIDWPVGGRPVQLLARGEVMRSDATHTAVRVQRYTFRTRGNSAPLTASADA